jgi:cellulose synthase/poly-beta-1,6-N-acetylglucosamine synthase-like glycosyltransferase
VLIRHAWLEQVGAYQEQGWPEDYDLWLRLHAAGAKFAKVPEVLLYWRERPDRLTRTDGRYAVENFLRAKAHYLCQGPLEERDAVLIWGAGQMGRRISKHLARGGAQLAAFIDIDPGKIGRKKRGLPIIAAEDAIAWWERYRHPIVLAAVGSRGARSQIREYLGGLGLVEGRDFLAVA